MAEKSSASSRSSRVARVKKVSVPAKAIVTVTGGPVKGFVDFIRTQGVVGLAVGLVLGGAVSILVKSLVDNIVMPPIGLLLGSADGLKGLSVTIGDKGTPAVIHYGTFLNDFINFVVIALVVYLVFNLLGLTKLDKKKV
ncbi:MAG: Large-conductance mechanosensitive channel-like protein [Candidatus Saccharibacteria bacterium]|nr:Large-conductance mechanosensitive channel-like protein [Candidatus Saccharibacteria bacterium]